MSDGNLIDGLAYSYSQIQNLKTTYYQTKLRTLIVYEKRKVLGWSFLVGGVHKWRVDKIKLVIIKVAILFLIYIISRMISREIRAILR
jgi:hypothetical protein